MTCKWASWGHSRSIRKSSSKPVARAVLPLVCCIASATLALPLLIAESGSPALIQFTNVTDAAGIHWTHSKASNGISTILEEAGPGVCVADFDGDGFQDIYFVNGRDLYNRGLHLQNALYRNNGNGTFTDVTEKAGVPGNGYGLGCVWGDYDNDGHPDLYVTQYGKNILYHNNGNGTFTDVTQSAHVDGTDFGTVFHSGATFFDYDRDGKLDLYVGGYAHFTPTSQRHCKIGFGVLTSCLPAVYGGTPDVLYHNNGDGTFTNVTKAAKIYQPKGLNLSVQAIDYDNDGWPDLFVANDGIEAYLYHNNHNGTFSEVGLSSGMALTADGATMAAMCMSLGDYDNDGQLDLYVSDFQLASDHLWHNDGKGFFQEVSETAGIREPTRNVLSFGGGFFDYDNDGWLDLFIANGHVYEEVERTTPDIHYKQINSLFHNEGNGTFIDVTKVSGEGFMTPHAGRGAAFADFDNDGNVDVVVANNNDPPLLLHNSGARGRHFVSF
jgi:enediyne biosynthesis protein E4